MTQRRAPASSESAAPEAEPATPTAGEARQPRHGAEPMRKERIVKEDGRYLYYFWFGDRAAAAEQQPAARE